MGKLKKGTKVIITDSCRSLAEPGDAGSVVKSRKGDTYEGRQVYLVHVPASKKRGSFSTDGNWWFTLGDMKRV